MAPVPAQVDGWPEPGSPAPSREAQAAGEAESEQGRQDVNTGGD